MATHDKVRVLLLADLHFNEWPQHSKVERGINNRLRMQVDTLCDLVDKANADIIIVAGDIIHKHGMATPVVQDAIITFFRHAYDCADEVHVIPGNHDYLLNSGGGLYHGFMFLEQMGVKVHTTPRVADVAMMRIGFVPWKRNVNDYKADVAMVVDKGIDLLISHVAVAGFKADNGFELECAITKKHLKADQVDYVFLGDLHTRQVHDNIIYIGAPYQMTWGDRHDTARGGLVLDVSCNDRKKLSFVMDSVTSDKHPVFKIVDTIDEAKTELSGGNFVKLVTDDAKDIKKVGAGVVVEVLPPTLPKKRLNVNSDSTIIDILDAYLDSVEELPLDKEKLRKLCVELVQSVNSAELASKRDGMYFKPGKLTATNFLSYQSLDVELSKAGVVLIEGNNLDDKDALSNGAGKSAIIEALYYVMTGDTLRGTSVGDITRNGAKGGCSVILEIEMRDGRMLEISRVRKVKGLVDGVHLKIDGNEFHSDNPQVYIEEATGIDKRLFKQVVVFGQEVNTLFAASTDAERKSLLENLCSGSQFEPVSDAAKRVRDDVMQSMQSMQGKLNSAFIALDKAQHEHDRVKKLRDDFDRLRQFRIEEKKDIINSLEANRAMLEETRKDLIKQLDEAQGKLEISETTNVPTMQFARDKIKALTEERVRLGTDAGVAEAEARRLVKQRDSMLRDTVCSTCGQDLPVNKEQIHVSITKLSNQINANGTLVANAKDEMLKINHAIKKIEDNISGAESQHRHLQDALSDAEADVKQITFQIERDTERIEDAKSALEQIEKNTENPHTYHVEKYAREMQEADKQINKLEDGLKSLEDLQPYVSEAVKLFGNQGLKTFLFDSLAPRITELANEALQVLSSGSLSISLTTERKASGEKIVLDVVNHLGAPAYKGNSGGQKRKIDFALCWAISQIVDGTVNVFFIDEAFDGLDALAIERVNELIQKRKGDASVFVVTHRQEFKEFFSQVWVAEKSGGISRLIIP